MWTRKCESTTLLLILISIFREILNVIIFTLIYFMIILISTTFNILLGNNQLSLNCLVEKYNTITKINTII